MESQTKPSPPIPVNVVEQLERHIDKQLENLREWLDARLGKLESCKEPGLQKLLDKRFDGLQELLQSSESRRLSSISEREKNSVVAQQKPDVRKKATLGDRYEQQELTSSVELTRWKRRGSVSSDGNDLSDRESEGSMEMHPWWAEALKRQTVSRRESGNKVETRSTVPRLAVQETTDLCVSSHEKSFIYSYRSDSLVGKWMAHPSSAWRLVWQVLGTFLIIYDLITIPVFIAFNPPEKMPRPQPPKTKPQQNKKNRW